MRDDITERDWSWIDIPFLACLANGLSVTGMPGPKKAGEILDHILTETTDAQLDALAVIQTHNFCRATGKNFSRVDASYLARLKEDRAMGMIRIKSASEKIHPVPHNRFAEVSERAVG